MKVFLGLLLIAGFGILGVPAPPGSTLCFSCNAIDDPHQCTNMAKCNHEDMCYTEVNQVSGVNVFTMSCKPRPDCDILSVIGKRDAATVCRKFCPTSGCNKDLCVTVDTSTPMPASATSTATTHVLHWNNNRIARAAKGVATKGSKKAATNDKAVRSTDKKRKRRRRASYSTYIYKILRH